MTNRNRAKTAAERRLQGVLGALVKAVEADGRHTGATELAAARRELGLPGTPRKENQPMCGVEVAPLEDKGVCRNHLDGGLCPAAGQETPLWRVAWGDGVKMDLCTRCMASLVIEE